MLAWLGLGPPGAGGGGPPRDWKPVFGRGVLGTGGGGPPEVSCLDERLGRPFGRSGTLLPRPPAGPPGSLGGPPPPPKGGGPEERPPGGSVGPRLGGGSAGEKGNKFLKFFSGVTRALSAH